MSGANNPIAQGPKIGIDLGGTKTEIIVLSATGATLMRQRVATPSQSYSDIVQTIAALVAQARQVSGPVAHVGIGIPGAPQRRTGLIKNANTTCLIGRPLAQDLQQMLGLPVKLENDANCFTLSEAIDGSGAGYGVVFGVILGTGVGAGWCLNGQLHSGMHHIGGEWGHNPIPLRLRTTLGAPEASAHASIEPFVETGRHCYCGKVDCIETHLCGTGLAKTHRALCTQTTPAINQHTTLQPLWSVPDIVRAAEQGEPTCQAALALYVRQLASALATVINTVDPDVVVLGGGLSNLDGIYPHIQQALSEFVFNNEVCTPVLKATHGDSSGVRGAAWL